MNKPELLVPAGTPEKVTWAVKYGADAVYIGGDDFSLRANAINFDLKTIARACRYCHDHNVKLYVAVNIVFHESDLAKLDDYVFKLNEIGIDAIIVSDVAVIKRIKALTPNLNIHVSTQASIYNREAALYYESIGAKRVVLARECPKSTIKDIITGTNLEVEVFIHGAMCAGFSGRCTLSNVINDRDANHGGCSQVCRFDFELYEQDKNVTGKVPFSLAAKDLMMADYIKELTDLGVASLKIEGRMRSIYYIAMITNAYRYIIDNKTHQSKRCAYNSWYNTALKHTANRETIAQFFNDVYDERASYYNGRSEVSNQDFLGIVKAISSDYLIIEERNAFEIGDKATLISPGALPINFVIKEMFDEDDNPITRANHPHQTVKIPVSFNAKPGDIIHRQFS